MDKRYLCLTVFLIIATSASAKQFYKCVDVGGSVTFGDLPCQDAKEGPQALAVHGYEPPTKSAGDSSVSNQIQWLEAERAEKRARIQAERERKAEQEKRAKQQLLIHLEAMKQQQQQQQMNAIQQNTAQALDEARRAREAAEAVPVWIH